jgi:hypothetical protein
MNTLIPIEEINALLHAMTAKEIEKINVEFWNAMPITPSELDELAYSIAEIANAG